MYSLQIFKGKDLKAKSMEELARLFGKSGNLLLQCGSWNHHGEVKPHRIQKSVGVEHTFGMTSTKMKNFFKTKITKRRTRI